ncbi:uncharacterized protein [Cicer arietinum]|uniref:Uncharacterized protein LOC101494040 n=1 Tax=Cicer arietinum TaxID=3827 RepID=A0A1S2Z3I4_CICAR|nr:uncharacterized protein LOC101494040 [Cicer arietinum]
MVEMLRREGIHGWRWRRQLFAWEEELVEQCRILLANVHLQVNVSDKWSWNNTQGVSYSLKEAYYVLQKEFFASINTPLFQDLVWHPFVQAKVSLFMWRLFQDKLPTKENLFRRGIISVEDQQCLAGCGEVEIVSHLFFVCPLFGSVWYGVLNWFALFGVFHKDAINHANQFDGLFLCGRVTRQVINLIWFAVMWAIWKLRNEAIFRSHVLNANLIIEHVKLLAWRWIRLHVKEFCYGYNQWCSQPL